MRADAVLTFLVVDALLVLTPGPDWAYVLAAGLRERMLLPAVGGLVAGYAALTLLVAAGVGALITATPAALTAVTLVGGLYLVWLGAGSVRRRGRGALDWEAPRPSSAVGVALRGAGTSGLNPKGLLLFVAVLPQFVNRVGTWPVGIQIMVFGAVHMSNCAVGYLGVGSLARSMLSARPGAIARLTRAAGVAMMVLGMLLLVERVR